MADMVHHNLTAYNYYNSWNLRSEELGICISARISGGGDFLPTTYRDPRHYNSSASVPPPPLKGE